MTDPIPTVEAAVAAEAVRVDAAAKSVASRLEADAAKARGEVAAVKTGLAAFRASPAFVPALVVLAALIAVGAYFVHKL